MILIDNVGKQRGATGDNLKMIYASASSERRACKPCALAYPRQVTRFLILPRHLTMSVALDSQRKAGGDLSGRSSAWMFEELVLDVICTTNPQKCART